MAWKCHHLRRQIMPAMFTHRPHINSKSDYYYDSGQDNRPLEVPFPIPNLYFIAVSFHKDRNFTNMSLVNPTKHTYWKPKHSTCYLIRVITDPFFFFFDHRSLNSLNNAHDLERFSIPASTATEQLVTQLVVLAIFAI